MSQPIEMDALSTAEGRAIARIVLSIGADIAHLPAVGKLTVLTLAMANAIDAGYSAEHRLRMAAFAAVQLRRRVMPTMN